MKKVGASLSLLLLTLCSMNAVCQPVFNHDDTLRGSLNAQRDWFDIGFSDNGEKIVAVVRTDGYIYGSSDYGVTWNQQAVSVGSSLWGYIAISGNGQYMVAGILAAGNLLPISFQPYLIFVI